MADTRDRHDRAVARFLLRRILLAIPILLGVSIVVFVTIKLIPGNPVDSLLGPSATPAMRSALTHRLGLDRPLPVQYIDWLRSVLRGDLGTSIAQQLPVRPMVVNAFANTLLLALGATVFALVGGFLVGLVAALRNGKFSGRIASLLASTALSAPQYSVALVALVVLAVDNPVFPAGGMHAVSGGGLVDLFEHLVLPSIAAGLAPLGVVARMFRSALIDVSGQEFVLMMRARGLSRTRVLVHVIHNTLPSLLTVTGLQLGYLLGGVVFVETIFAWPGLGQLVFNSVSSRDLPVIQAGVLVTAVAFVLINVLVDTAHALIDPRIRQSALG